MKTRSELHVEITKNCVLKCIHCSSNQILTEKAWVLSNFTRLIEFIKANSNQFNFIVTLTGGEPLLLAELPDLINELSILDNVESIGIFTCGCVIKSKSFSHISLELAKQLFHSGMNFCYISLYSHLKEKHESITTVTGSFENTIKSIEFMKSVGISVRVNCVLNSNNIKDLNSIYDFCKKIDIDELRILRLVKHGRAKENWYSIGVSDDDQKNEVKRLIGSTNSELNITIAGFPEIWSCRPFNLGNGCQAGRSLFYVNTEGEIFPCASKKLDPSFICITLKGKNPQLRIEIEKKVNSNCSCDIK